MSSQMRDKLDPDLFSTGKPDAKLEVLEFSLNFEKFSQEKTIDNVVEWMEESVAEAKVIHDDFGHILADGGFNAIGSVREFELKGREEGRVNNLDFNICASHQNERSSDYASGLGGFVENQNEELGDILKKNHTIQTELNCHPGRMRVYAEVQKAKGRKPPLNPHPSVQTRWQCKQMFQSHMFVFCIFLLF